MVAWGRITHLGNHKEIQTWLGHKSPTVHGKEVI